MNGSLATAVIGGTVGDTLALLALLLSITLVSDLVATGHRSSRKLIRDVTICTTLLGVIEATIWSLTFHNAYDAPGSWCWTCAPLLDALGEITENMLTMVLLGSSLGLVIGITRRPLRRFLYRRFYLRSAHWRELRHAWWQRHPDAFCIRCWTRAYEHHADLHHLTYARIGHELDTDLAPIHRTCHIQQHGH